MSDQTIMAQTPIPASSTPVPPVILRDPRTAQVQGEYRPERGPEIATRVRLARHAQSAWAARTPRERSQLLHQFADRMERAIRTLVIGDCAERGVNTRQSRAEMEEAADIFRYYGGALRTSTAPMAMRWIQSHHSRVSYRPLGVVAAILPWNYPALMFAWRVAPILAAGNVVIVKPAEETPSLAMAFAQIAEEVFGPDVVQVVRGDRATGGILAAADVDAVAFTGSAEAGRSVAIACAPRPAYLELGGNCPAIFTDSAPEGSERDLIAAAFHNAGQSCAGPSRIITLSEHGSARIARAVRDYKGNQPVITETARNRILARVLEAAVYALDAVEQNMPLPMDGYYYPATAVFLSSGAQTPLRTAETFGPVVTVEQAESFDHALGLALDPSCHNDLAASVWTTDLEEAHQAGYVLGLHVGEVWVNCALAQTAELPHSGGNGVDLGAAALDQYRRPTTVTTRLER